MIIIIPILIVTTTEQLISKRGGKMASHACPPHLRKLLSAHFVFYILHILADCCTDSVSHYFFVDWNQLASPSPSPFLASAKCFVSSNNWALCIFGCQPSAVSSGCLSPQKLRGKWSLRPGTDPVTTLPTEDLKMLTGVSRGKSDFSLESAQWGGSPSLLCNREVQTFLVKVLCVKNMLSILLVRTHLFDEIKCDICSYFKQLNQC